MRYDKRTEHPGHARPGRPPSSSIHPTYRRPGQKEFTVSVVITASLADDAQNTTTGGRSRRSLLHELQSVEYGTNEVRYRQHDSCGLPDHPNDFVCFAEVPFVEPSVEQQSAGRRPSGTGNGDQSDL